MIKIKNINIILFFVLIFLTIVSDARTRGRKPKVIGSREETLKSFEESVKRYKELKQEKYSLTSEEKRSLAKRSFELKKRSSDSISAEEAKASNNKVSKKRKVCRIKVKRPAGQIKPTTTDSLTTTTTVDAVKPTENPLNLETAEKDLNNGLNEVSDDEAVDFSEEVEKKYFPDFWKNKDWKKKTTKKTTKTTKKTTTKKTTKKASTTTTKKAVPTTTKKAVTTKKSTTTKKAVTTKKSTTTKKVVVTTKKTTKKTTTTTTTKKTTTKATTKASSAQTNNAKVFSPKPGTKFQWQLKDCDDVDTSVDADVYDIDLFDTSKSDIQKIKNKGRKVICYFSGGTVETWRDDADKYDDADVILAPMEDWDDEYWVDITSSKVKKLIEERLDMAVSKGCDGVEIDNVDGYTFKENNFKYNDQITFNKWLSEASHKRNLSVGLKNDIGQIPDLLPHFDWALNEECYEYGECEHYKPFINAKKAVFGVSYLSKKKDITKACNLANSLKLDYQIKDIDLDASKIDCKEY